MHAVKYNRQRIVSVLSTCEKEMGRTDKYGASALSMAAESGNAQVLGILLKSPIADKEVSLVDKMAGPPSSMLQGTTMWIAWFSLSRHKQG